jgi:nitrogen fixation protein NifU and related proteins
MSDLRRLYQQSILEHDKAPRHAVRLAGSTHTADVTNPLCGDRVSLTLQVDGEQLADVGCEVKGCAICRASGSMMAESIVGRDLAAVRGLCERFIAAVNAPAAPSSEPPEADAEVVAWGPLSALLEARRFSNRRRCATLSWEALARALPR